ncbi:hypothetical protein [Galbibacter orientalis]|uniref:hypothetical protein n=1 Tax=Galbibacter orientalis TaxID=453852 RepID=UPI00308098AD
MKKLNFLYIIISILITACGGSDDGPEPVPEPTPEPVNNAPSLPNLDYPTEDLVCIDNNVTFKWLEATDKDGDKITYQVQISDVSDFSKTDYNDLTPDLSKKYNLPKGKTFYWRVKAIDSKEAESSYTKASRFFTERDAEVNQVPNQPTIITPANNIVISKSSVSIQWQATDPDNDVILYDMYFGTDPEALPLIIESASQNNYLATLQPKTKYYWKIVVKDDIGGVTIGNIWSFSTN